MGRTDELRLIARAARMYFLDDMKQSEIAARLRVSQASISRLLQRARDERIVRITVESPRGTYPELEEQLCSAFGLREAIVADCSENREEQVLARIGEAAAYYLETTLQKNDVIGISSWSESLLRTVDSLHPFTRTSAECVVQILGGMGNPAVQAHATNLTTRMAQLTNAKPMLLPTQGVTGSAEAKLALVSDSFVQQTLAYFPRLTVALVGVGSVEPSKLLADSGNVFTKDELSELARLGAVGDICVHFFDIDGRPVQSSFDERVIGVTLEELRRVPRVVAVAGGQRKTRALLGAMRGGYIDVLVTDCFTATRLLAARSKPSD
jgi:DNA-binding transcriptional regulator LsrR (DeoR family)